MSEESITIGLIQKLRLFVNEGGGTDSKRLIVTKLLSRLKSEDRLIQAPTADVLCRGADCAIGVFLTMLKDSPFDPLCPSIATIINICVTTSTGLNRSTVIKELIAADGTVIILRLTITLYKRNWRVSDYLKSLLGIASELASKDGRFSCAVRSLKANKDIHQLLKGLSQTKASVQKAILSILKSCLVDRKCLSVMINDGITYTLERLMMGAVISPNNKLKLILENVYYLCRSKNGNQKVARSGIIPQMVIFFEKLDTTEYKFKMSLTYTALSVIQQLGNTRVGISTLQSQNMFPLLLKFCYQCQEGKAYDRLIMKICLIINTCTERKCFSAKDLVNPFKFPLPDIHGIGSHIQPRKDSADTIQSVESVEEDDEDEHDYTSSYDSLSEMNGIDNSGSDTSESSLDKETHDEAHDLQDLLLYEEYWSEYSPHSSYNQPNSLKYELWNRDLEKTNILEGKLQRQENYETYIFTKNRSICEWSNNFSQNGSENTTYNTSEGPHDLSLLTIECDVIDRSFVYEKISSSIKTVLPVIKQAYPDIHVGDYGHFSELYDVKGKTTYRKKVLNCVSRRLNRQSFKEIIVFDVESLPSRDCKRSTSNSDRSQVGIKREPKENLIFESRFESGNLRTAIKVGPTEYDLITMPDVNSTGHTQWFYFEVSNMESGVPYVFNIINFEKKSSQYNCGMKPVMYSVQDAMVGQPHWRRVGTEICYFKNGLLKNVSKKDKKKNLYTLSFSMTFQHPNDICYFAYHYPYTYSQLMTDIWMWLNTVPKSTIYFRVDKLCSTLNGNEVPLLTITNSESESNLIKDREIVMLTSRVHPGESNASWLMKGTIEYLFSDAPAAQKARELYVFKIVPMLNIEGVINGCHRCGLTNQDLNRVWDDPDPTLHPVIYKTKGLIEYCTRLLNKKPYIYCDYHGHSQKKNFFIYGCLSSLSWNEKDNGLNKNNNEKEIVRSFPNVINSISSLFCPLSSKFDVTHNKEATARVVFWREYNVLRSYTIEVSYCGFDNGNGKGHHCSIFHLIEIGGVIIQGIASTEEINMNDIILYT